MARPSLGNQELDVLQYVTDHQPVAVREVATVFAERRGLARTTILTVMERLRKKGYLVRSKAEGIFRYSASLPKAELLRNLIRDFTERVLGGSLQPFVAYMAEDAEVTDQELTDLQRLVRTLKSKRKS